MTVRNFDRFELLTTLKAILEQGNLVGAARARGMTQSAASKHLAKLRLWFEDDLFVRSAGGLQPTEKAIAIGQAAHGILQDVEALSQSVRFDPSTFEGEFVIATTDQIAAHLLPALLPRLEAETAGVRITILPLPDDYALRKLEQGLVQLVISVNWHAPETLMQKRLYGDRFVCLLSERHPLAAKPLTLDDYANASHAMVAPLGMTGGVVDQYLAKKNRKRSIKVSVPSFLQISYDLLGDDTIVTLPHRVAMQAAKPGDLMIKQLPFELPMIDYYVFWHRRHTNTQSNQWMRNLIAQLLVD